MSQFVVYGGKRLEGELQISGSKNAVLPIMAATLLNEGVTMLENCPKISDVEIMQELLLELGCKVEWHDHVLFIDTSTLNACEISERLVKRMRSSIILLGALLGRCGEAKMSKPGGCQLGARPINYHLSGLASMGVEINEQEDIICCKTRNLQGATINLKFPSVGATENIMLAAVKSSGMTIINNPAREPEIVDLQNYLISCGAQIKGAGTGQIIIRGVEKLSSIRYRVIPDRIIAGTYMAAAAITRGNIRLTDVSPQDLSIVTKTFEKMGCRIITEKNTLELFTPKVLHGIDIETAPHPGFPTDMQSQMLALLCTCHDISRVTERLFEARFKTVEELRKMGAQLKIEEEQVIITPCKKLIGANVMAKDLRGGASLVVAGLAAEGCTIVDGIEHIKRGYADIVSDLTKLGAQIEERI